LKQLSRHLTFANVVSCIALFLALSGAAVAAKTAMVRTQNLANGAVTTPKLRNGAVTTPKLRNGAVIANKLRNGAVTGAKIGEAAIGASKLANGAVRSKQLGGGVVTEAKLKAGAVSSSKLAPSFLAQLVRNVSYHSAETGTNTEQTKSETAFCPSGKEAIGGGVRLSGELADVAVTGSSPYSEGTARTGWSGFAHETGAGEYDDWSLEAFVVCAEL
jgi:hypothetical protein